MAGRALVVVSGLPASGKTTVGGLLARELGLPLVDKDEVLEALFDALGCANPDERWRLSRAADEVLFTIAASAATPVLVNWWHHDTAPPRLRSISAHLVEVFCDCPVELAAERFEARTRHPGHHDPVRSPAEVAERIRHVRATYRGPLALGGPLVRVDTSGELDRRAVVAEVHAALALAGVALTTPRAGP